MTTNKDKVPKDIQEDKKIEKEEKEVEEANINLEEDLQKKRSKLKMQANFGSRFAPIDIDLL